MKNSTHKQQSKESIKRTFLTKMCLLDPQLNVNILMTINLKNHLGEKEEKLMWIMRKKANKPARVNPVNIEK